MTDFKTLNIEVLDRKRRVSPWFRDHGHGGAIRFSREAAKHVRPGCTVKYVWETGDLFLKTREALEQNRRIVVQPFEQSGAGLPAASLGA